MLLSNGKGYRKQALTERPAYGSFEDASPTIGCSGRLGNLHLLLLLKNTVVFSCFIVLVFSLGIGEVRSAGIDLNPYVILLADLENDTELKQTEAISENFKTRWGFKLVRAGRQSNFPDETSSTFSKREMWEVGAAFVGKGGRRSPYLGKG